MFGSSFASCAKTQRDKAHPSGICFTAISTFSRQRRWLACFVRFACCSIKTAASGYPRLLAILPGTRCCAFGSLWTHLALLHLEEDATRRDEPSAAAADHDQDEHTRVDLGRVLLELLRCDRRRRGRRPCKVAQQQKACQRGEMNRRTCFSGFWRPVLFEAESRDGEEGSRLQMPVSVSRL